MMTIRSRQSVRRPCCRPKSNPLGDARGHVGLPLDITTCRRLRANWSLSILTHFDGSWEPEPPPLRVNTHAAPAGPRPKGLDRSDGLSPGPPTMAVSPSADNATDMPWRGLPSAPLPTSFLPCCVQTPLLRVNTHAAPVLLLSDHPPTMAVLPSADSATALPWRGHPPHHPALHSVTSLP